MGYLDFQSLGLSKLTKLADELGEISDELLKRLEKGYNKIENTPPGEKLAKMKERYEALSDARMRVALCRDILLGNMGIEERGSTGNKWYLAIIEREPEQLSGLGGDRWPQKRKVVGTHEIKVNVGNSI